MFQIGISFVQNIYISGSWFALKGLPQGTGRKLKAQERPRSSSEGLMYFQFISSV